MLVKGQIDKEYAGEEASYSWLDASVILMKKGDVLVSSEIAIKNYYELEDLRYKIILAFYDSNNKLLGTIISDDVSTIQPRTTNDTLETSIGTMVKFRTE